MHTIKNWKIWTAFLTVFVAGVIVGVVGVGIMLQNHFNPSNDPAQFREQMRARMLEDFIDTVQPNATDIPAITDELDQLILKMEVIKSDMQPRFKTLFHESKERIKAYLTPEQKDRFEAMIKDRLHGKFNLFRLPPPPPPMP